MSKEEAFGKAFEKIWSDLFSSPVHLDSALSKQTPAIKSLLAQIVPQILLQPVSISEALGVGVTPGEPWSLNAEELARWRPAAQVAQRLWQTLTSGGVKSKPMLEDYPPQMIQSWAKTWGDAVTQNLVKALAQTPPLTLRAARGETPQQLLKRLRDEKDLPIKATPTEASPWGLSFAGYVPVLSTQAYDEGWFEIQDEGSQVMALFALMPEEMSKYLTDTPAAHGTSATHAPVAPRTIQLKPFKPLTVVDACAGAGGKTLALADALQGKGRVYAYDTSDKKLMALRRRAKRAGINNVQAVVVTDQAEDEVVAKFAGRADVVLVDAPCSGWGVLRRNPDIKWRQSAEVLERMPEIQQRLLGVYSKLVAPKGRLVFGLCTFRKEESTEVVEKFLATHAEFRLVASGFFGPHPSDGFFMAALERTS